MDYAKEIIYGKGSGYAKYENGKWCWRNSQTTIKPMTKGGIHWADTRVRVAWREFGISKYKHFLTWKEAEDFNNTRLKDNNLL
tara:strand:+ start:84 stop:332 length:249 start_codon:yes stop_codon:yes gene_type:complete